MNNNETDTKEKTVQRKHSSFLSKYKLQNPNFNKYHKTALNLDFGKQPFVYHWIYPKSDATILPSRLIDTRGHGRCEIFPFWAKPDD